MFVPKMQRLTVMRAGLGWSTGGSRRPCRPAQCAQRSQRRVANVFDRRFAGAPWLSGLHGHQLRFIMRCPPATTRHQLVDAKLDSVALERRFSSMYSRSLLAS